MKFLEELSTSESDKTEPCAKANGLLQQVRQFKNYFLLRLMYKVLSRAETVSSALQKNDLDLYQAQLKLDSLKVDIGAMRIDFDLF